MSLTSQAFSTIFYDVVKDDREEDVTCEDIFIHTFSKR